MSYMLLRVVIIVLIFGAIFLGVRRIWRDWTGQAKAVDQARRARDLQERARPDVIDLKRSDDGVYRPPGKGDHRRD
ncbi:MAG TPA: hypothetical protein VGN80_11330 [Devosiaceae bacterium]|jgi:cytoskeletal protein RodZ|nr:hypothetical protein [Devosiaceae bacterium]